MNDFTTSLRRAVLVLWHAALFIIGIAGLVSWVVAWWLERAIGNALARLVGALPKKYRTVLLDLAVFTLEPDSEDDL